MTHPTIDAAALGRWMDTEKLPGDGVPGTDKAVRRVAERAVRRRARRHQGSAPHPAAHRGRGARSTACAASRACSARSRARTSRTPSSWPAPDDPKVLGAPFYLMQPVDGWSPMGHGRWPEPFESDPEQRRGLAFELVRGAALLSKVDWQARGLDGLRPPGELPRAPGRPLAGASWPSTSSATCPASTRRATGCATTGHRHWEPGIMHGDYQFANVMYAHGAPARLAAVIDWEMTTIGDPLLDLGWVLISWPPEGDDMTRYVEPRRHAEHGTNCSSTTRRSPGAPPRTSTTTWCSPAGSSASSSR